MSSYTAESAVIERGMRLLLDGLGIVDTERFLAFMNREKDNYDIWREKYFEKMTPDEYKKELYAFSKAKRANS